MTKPTAGCAPDRVIRQIHRTGGRVLIGLVGVRTNQFPRALDLARPFIAAGLLWWFRAMTMFEGVHPLEGGGLRRKFRRDRCSTLPRENALRFYPRYAVETVRKLWGELALYRDWTVIRREVTRDPNRWNYTDLAIAPPREDEFDTLDLYHATNGGEAALARQQ
jgi:hypothetical protein